MPYSKQNLIIRLGIIVLVITMLLTVFVGGTYAKYTTVVGGSDSARVAAFYVDTVGEKLNVIDIFSTAYKGEGVNADKDTVKGEKDIIAPGTQGSFDIAIDYLLEVDSYYDLTFEEIQTPVDSNIPIIYSVDDGVTWYDAPSLPTAIEENVDTIIKAGKGQKITKVLWKWAFEKDLQDAHVQSNEYDTELGFDAQAQVELKISLSVTQID